MRNELQHIEKIELYITGKLNKEEVIAFENEIAQNPTLAKDVANQKLIQQAAVRKAIRADVMKFGAGGTSGFSWGKILGGSFGVIVVLLASLWYFNSTPKETDENTINLLSYKKSTITHKFPITNQDTLLVTTTTTTELDEDTLQPKNNANTSKNNSTPKKISYSEDTECGGLKTWLKPDVQEFKIDPKKGKTIEGNDGTLVIVPTDAFINDEGNLVDSEVTLELVEALKVSDMLAYNLTTMNNKNMLQTGGMIYVQPYANGEKVNINPERPLYIEIPTDEYNPDMMAWKGETNEEGNINWVEPQPLKKYLTKVDFENLDFIPNGFDEAVAAGLPFKNHTTNSKFLVDSLYYSLGVEITEEKILIDSLVGDNNNIIALDDNNQRIMSSGGTNSNFTFREWLELWFGKKYLNGKTQLYGRVQNEFGQTPKGASIYIYQNGFVNKKDITTDDRGYFSFNKLEAGDFRIQVIKSGCDYFMSENFTSNGEDVIKLSKPLTLKTSSLNLTSSKVPMNKIENINYDEEKLKQLDSNNKTSCYINPLSVKTIKSEAFANSFLATKEFEQRIKILHQMPNAQELFELYVNNLGKDLYIVDAMVAQKLKGAEKTYFENFAKEKLTNVKDANIYQEQLSKYYNEKKKENIETQQKIHQTYAKKSKEDLMKYQSQMKQLVADYNQITASNAPNNTNWSSFGSKVNLPVKSKEIPQSNVVTAPRTYATTWFSAGWMNIDAYLKLINDNPKEVTVDVKGKKGAKVYQFLNTLKTIVPITIIGTIGSIKFPKKGTTDASVMSNTYAIGIAKNNGKLFYGSKKYNPYSLDQFDMEWKEVSAEELKNNLKKLDGPAAPLLKEIEAQEKFIQKQLEIKAQKEALKKEMDSLQVKLDKELMKLTAEKNYIQSLERVINECGVSSSNNSINKESNTEETKPQTEFKVIDW